VTRALASTRRRRRLASDALSPEMFPRWRVAVDAVTGSSGTAATASLSLTGSSVVGKVTVFPHPRAGGVRVEGFAEVLRVRPH
jgi:hypothetical protein